MFPCAPLAVRVAMFFGAVAMAGLAALFYGHSSHEPPPYAGRAAVAVAVFSGLIALYFWVMLVNVLSQRRPAQVWTRFNRLWDATCKPPSTVRVSAHRSVQR